MFVQGEMISLMGITHPSCSYYDDISGRARRYSPNFSAEILKESICLFPYLFLKGNNSSIAFLYINKIFTQMQQKRLITSDVTKGISNDFNR